MLQIDLDISANIIGFFFSFKAITLKLIVLLKVMGFSHMGMCMFVLCS